MPTALVTGASGFAGAYLAKHLYQLGYNVWGTAVSITSSLEFETVQLDIRDSEGFRWLLATLKPDELYHLAGIAQPSLGLISEFYDVNLKGTLNVLQSALEVSPKSKILNIGSAYMYGAVNHPINEEEVLKPRNHYGASKAAADMLAYAYSCQGLHVIRARPFNHSGPGQQPVYLLPTLVQQFAAIAKGEREPVVRLGNLDSVRDFSDVRDIVVAYHLALQNGKCGEAYNLGSGYGVSVTKLFQLMKDEFQLAVTLEVETGRQRTNDLPYLVADTEKAATDLRWRTSIPLRTTIRDMYRVIMNSNASS